MKTPKQIPNFDWALAWRATQILCFIAGVVAIVVAAATLHPWMLAGAVLALVTQWALIYKILIGAKAYMAKTNPTPATLQDVRKRLLRASEKSKDAIVGQTLRACVGEIDRSLGV